MNRSLATLASLGALVALGGCELGPKAIEQTGYRGTALVQLNDKSSIKEAGVIPPPPYELPADGGPTAAQTYQNVQVLGGLSTERFNHLMASITQWVSPEQGCNYCHNPENMASDEKYTKAVARSMLRMTSALNNQWQSHTQQTGVTCYTCHRGNPVPAYVWNREPAVPEMAVRGQKRGQNTPDPNVGYASLPSSTVFEDYLSGNPKSVRVASSSPYPGWNPGVTTRNAEDSYGIMMHVSKALGVNCTYCHNSQSFRSWSLSRAQRATAWYGIRMVRDVNSAYIEPLANVFPANRKGPLGDPYKVNCLTCHQGLAKPLGGQSMIADYPYLRASYSTLVPTAGGRPEGGTNGAPAALAEPGAMTSDVNPPNAPAPGQGSGNETSAAQ
jgi:photosynthetic reaction center cytochrome c subunit